MAVVGTGGVCVGMVAVCAGEEKGTPELSGAAVDKAVEESPESMEKKNVCEV